MHRSRLKLLVAIVAVFGMFSFATATGASAHEGVHPGDAVTVSSNSGTDLVSGNRADKVGEYDDIGILLTCYNYWYHSGHTDRTRWYHCHSTSDPYVKRVHICGVSGYLHGITVAYLYGAWLRNTETHAHDYGGEGC